MIQRFNAGLLHDSFVKEMEEDSDHARLTFFLCIAYLFLPWELSYLTYTKSSKRFQITRVNSTMAYS